MSTRRFVLLLLGFSAVLFGSVALAQVPRSDQRLTVTVTHVERNRFGVLITVKIANTSDHRLFLPQAPGWGTYNNLDPRVLTLGVQQWSDGKTNLLAAGRSLSSSLPPEARYFSVGPCRDLPFDDHWIRLEPGDHITDQIQAFEPHEDDFIPSSCGWRHARLLGPLRISVGAFRKTRIGTRRSVTGSVDLPVPQP